MNFNLCQELIISTLLLLMGFMLLQSGFISITKLQTSQSQILGNDKLQTSEWPSQLVSKSQRKIVALSFFVILVCSTQQFVIYNQISNHYAMKYQSEFVVWKYGDHVLKKNDQQHKLTSETKQILDKMNTEFGPSSITAKLLTYSAPLVVLIIFFNFFRRNVVFYEQHLMYETNKSDQRYTQLQ